MNGDTRDGHPVRVQDEDRLRHISRHVKTIVPTDGTDDEELNKFVQLFDSVISTCSAKNLSASYRVAAWNTVCALVDWTAESSDPTVTSLLWTTGLWQRALSLFLDHSDAARPKSSRQLLISLATALRKSEKHGDQHDAKQHLCDRLVCALIATEARRDTKASLNLLAHLLSKSILSLELLSTRFRSLSAEDESDPNPASKTLEHLLFATLAWTSKADFPSIIGQLISAMLDKPKTSRADQSLDLRQAAEKPPWATPLKNAFLHGHDSIDAYRSHIFPVLFRRDVKQYAAFVRDLGLGQVSPSNATSYDDNSSEELLAAALQTGKALGLVCESDSPEVSVEDGCVLIPLRFIVSMLQSSKRGLRLAGLALLIESHSITKPLELSALKQLRRDLPHFHADTDANFRSELFSLTQRMLDRMRASTAALARTAAHSEPGSPSRVALQDQQQFLHSYRRFLAWELRPTASYQRHISALKCLSLLLRSGVDESIPRDRLTKSASGDARWPFHVLLVDSGLQRLLIDLLMDPFDDVRQSSAAILSLQSSSAASVDVLPMAVTQALQVATSTMLASGRADHADGVAHLHSLSFTAGQTPEDRERVLDDVLLQAEHMLQIADDDLAMAVDKYPLHGLLTSLRYLLVRYEGSPEKRVFLHDRLLDIVQHVWRVVKPTLCDDAPEGYLPEDMEDLPEVTTKDVLSYCWRALKEASLLMSTMLSPAITQGSVSSDSKTSVFELCFRQLAELRHRGAFSTVAQTWVACCALMTQDNSAQGLETWQTRAMDLLKTSLTINTRRSAGLPSLICGILIAAKSDNLFRRAFSDLEDISRGTVDSKTAQEGSLPQVHAMNCMKDILKNTRLAETSDQYAPAALRLAADSLRSEAWAIRNCGLMLFRAVIDRLLGTNDAYLDGGLTSKKRVEFDQQPELLDLVMGLLLVDTSSTGGNEGVFPALQLLQRATIPASKQNEVDQAVFTLTASPSWHIRDKAARTYVSFVPMIEVASRLKVLLSTSSSNKNALHGALLCANYLLQRLNARLQTISQSTAKAVATIDDAPRCLDAVQKAVETHSKDPCPYILTALADVELTASETLSISASLRSDTVITPRTSVDLPISLPDVEGDGEGSVEPQVGNLDEQSALQHIHNAAEADEWLQTRAAYLEQECAKSGSINDLLKTILHEWTLACTTSLQDSSIFSREAAAASLAAFTTLWPAILHKPAWKPLCLELCLTTYDLLNDDDEDIRISAAQTTCKILTAAGNPTSPLVPLIATQRLATLLLSHFPTSTALSATALHRGFQLSTRPASVTSQLSTLLSTHSHALFATEKQNLYIDPAREIRFWSQIAAHLPHLDNSDHRLEHFAQWTLEGLQQLAAFFEARADGPLGWGSEGEVFAVGLRVVYAAEVLLAWVAQGMRVAVRPSQIRKGLVRLLEVGRKGGMSVLWEWEVERVVCGAFLWVVVGKGRSLHRITMGEL